MDAGQMTPVLVGIGIASGLGVVVFGWRIYQRCPHCGRLVRRAMGRGWRRCQHCGRQYRQGLRLR